MSYRKIAAGRIGIGPIVEQNGSQVETAGVGWAGTGECRAAIADHGGDVVITKQIEGLPAGVDVGLVAPRRGDVAVAELRENVAAVGAGRVDHRGEVAVAYLGFGDRVGAVGKSGVEVTLLRKGLAAGPGGRGHVADAGRAGSFAVAGECLAAAASESGIEVASVGLGIASSALRNGDVEGTASGSVEAGCCGGAVGAVNGGEVTEAATRICVGIGTVSDRQAKIPGCGVGGRGALAEQRISVERDSQIRLDNDLRCRRREA
jgi:hypothetical protein